FGSADSRRGDQNCTGGNHDPGGVHQRTPLLMSCSSRRITLEQAYSSGNRQNYGICREVDFMPARSRIRGAHGRVAWISAMGVFYHLLVMRSKIDTRQSFCSMSILSVAVRLKSVVRGSRRRAHATF